MSRVELEKESKPELLVKGWIPPPLGRDFTVVGKPLNRIDGPEKVTGRAKYAGDVRLPGMLYAKILRSPHAHARIKSIDTSEAEKVPGVRAVLSSANCAGWFTYWYSVPQPAFPETVSYVGQEIAAVAADSIDAARNALALIKVEYEELPAVFDVEEAFKRGSAQVTVTDVPNPADPETYGARKPPVGNIFEGKPVVTSRGDIQKGFAEADVIIERKYSTPFQHHGTIQTRTCVTYWDGERLTVHDSLQGVHLFRKDLAWSLGLPPEKVRVKIKYQGGGFGSKASAQRYVHYAAKLSMITRRPVRLELTRTEEFLSHPRRPACVVYLKTGVKRDGTITAMYGRGLVNIGAGGGYGAIKGPITNHSFVLYKCSNAYFEEWGVHTNLPLTGPMRSPIDVSATSIAEGHIDELAAAIGMDPLQFRLKNYTPYADQVHKTYYSAKKLDEAMLRVTEAIGWSRRRKPYGVEDSGTKKRGIGMSSYIYHGVGFPPYKAEARVLLSSTGDIELQAGVVDIGSGSATTLSQVAAEELGVSLSDIRTIYGDTELTPYSPSSHASRVIPEMGPAVLQAAAQAREKLFEFVAALLESSRSELRSSEGWIYNVRDRSKKMSFKDACSLIPSEGIVGNGSRAPSPSTNAGGDISEVGKISFATFGAAAAEVEVDIETGQVRVLRCSTAHEFGRALNPKLVYSQHYGGVTIGIGYGLLEEPIWDKKTGIQLNNDFHQYRMPTVFESPLEIIPFNIDDDDPYFAYSAKGGGESTNSGVPAAIRNAIYDATGVWLYDYPLTPEKVLAALAGSKKDGSKQVGETKEKELAIAV